MASKEKIKKRKKAAPAKINPQVTDSSLGSKVKSLVAENEDLPNMVSDENTKDSGREKQRSDTPSPPPVISSPTKKASIPPIPNTQKRSTSPFSQNKVKPLQSGSKDLSNPGSVVSLHSNSSVKEAWTGNEDDKKKPMGSQASLTSNSSNKLVAKQRGSTQIDTISIKSSLPDQNAYIPYLYAKGCIARITGDMKDMKDNHIRIVHDIEAHYRTLEGESQKQFMAFVMKYREKFQERLVSFQHMIQIYHGETSAKDENAKQEIESLKENNTKLLQEKNEALLHSKDEIDKMEADKIVLTSQIAAGGVGAAELARLQEENEALKEKILRLKDEEPSSSSSSTETSTTVPLLAAVPVPVKGRDDDDDRNMWKDHVIKLQEEVTQLKTENGHLTASNESYKNQLGQMADLAARFAALESQYKALSLVVVPSAETKMAAEEQLSKTKEDKVMMEGEQKRLDKEVKAWEKRFAKENGHPPTEADKSDSVRELYVQQAEVSQMVTSLDHQKETLTQLSSGTVPPPVDAGNAVAALAEPEVQVVEVTIPDPEIVNQLEASQIEVDELKAQIVLLSAAGGVAAASVGDETVDQAELDASNAALLQEQAAHDNTKTELENVQRQLEMMNETLKKERSEIESKMEAYKSTLETKIASRDEQIANMKSRNEELEEERLKGVPLDTAKEIKNLQNKIAVLEQEKSAIALSQAGETAKISELTRKLQLSEESLQGEKDKQKQLQERLKVVKKEKEDAVRDLTKLLSTRTPGRPARQKTQVGDAPAGRGDVASLKRENQELNARIKQLERESIGGVGFGAAAGGGDKKTQLRNEKILKELEKRYDNEKTKNAKLNENLKEKESEASSLLKGNNQKEAEIARLTAELGALGMAAKEGVAAAGKLKELEVDNKKLLEENKVLSENFNSERVLRKKYYNMVEDMKGKIRVYCRARPLSTSEKERGSHSVIKSMDEYTLSVTSQRGIKEFQYDQIFMESSTQEQIFEDTNNLIQSAIDGYNVCIFAYGQTGSGKTFTMIGDSKRNFPGLAPRAFERIFQMVEENKSKIDMTVTVYMMELYNDKLIDLFAKGVYADENKMEIKKDKKGMVFVQGAIVKSASNAKELNGLFEEGSLNRHTASTKMNAESSRSHLILSIVMESINKATGTVMKGKLSLVDLAGSERVGKTGANAEQLKEAMSINKSLSALGDVIAALSSEQSFIPYRNNKLTMLMQDSLGGNAKTLMFVNISPADYNVDETVISLTYASRVKLITNDANKNADSKEISTLKNIISKLRKGEAVEEEVE